MSDHEAISKRLDAIERLLNSLEGTLHKIQTEVDDIRGQDMVLIGDYLGKIMRKLGIHFS